MRTIVLVVGLLIAVLAAQAQDRATLPISTAESEVFEAETIAAAMRDAERLLEDAAPTDEALAAVRLELEALLATRLQRREAAAERLTEVGTRLEALGEEMAEEVPSVTTEREKLTAERIELSAEIGAIDDRTEAAIAMSEELAERRRTLFSEQLLSRRDVTTALSQDPLTSLGTELGEVRRLISSWVRSLVEKPRASIMAALVIAIGALAALAVQGRLRNMLTPITPKGERPTYLARVSRALGSIVTRTIAIIVLGALTFAVLERSGLISGAIEELLAAVLACVIGLQFTLTVLSQALAPSRPKWRLFALDDRAARRLFLLSASVAIVFVIEVLLGRIGTLTGAPLSLLIAKNFVSAIVNGCLLIAIARLTTVRLVPGEATPPVDPSAPPAADNDSDAPASAATEEGETIALVQPTRRAVVPLLPLPIRFPLLLAGAALVLAALLGYTGLAQFVARQIVITGTIVGTIYIGIQLSRSLSDEGALRRSSLGRMIARRRPVTEAGFDRLGVVASLAVGALVLAAGIPAVLLQWGFSASELGAWLVTVMRGVRIGSVTISLGGILFGVFVFAIGFLLTRVFQNWLDRTVMERGRVDPGVRNSVRTVVGYICLAVVALFALSIAGFNLASLAVVAGALSVGIGFGLQNIVSNFVSGLILLAERPFKVGDIVETGSTLGIIKRISVRSTVIETFSQQSVIVPNSDLINGVVSNWTLGNRATRAEMPVGVSYGADPRRVQEILLEIARAHPLSLDEPAPMVVFIGFGASSLDFELRFYLADVSDKIPTVNEVAYRVHERFSAEGIEIPFPQTDVHVRTLPEGESSLSVAA